MRTTHTTNDISRAGEARLGIPLRAVLAVLMLVSVSACRGESSSSEEFGGAEADAGQADDYQADAGQADREPAPEGVDSADQRMDDAESANDPLFDAERLEQMVAPVALYPDSLLTQVLMASTYPLEVVEADRWVKDNSDLRGEALDKALVDKNWDESVKSMTRFPDVLAQLSNNLDWTRDLGDAFLAQRGDVLNAVQTMRLGACDAGKLKTTAEQKVIIEPAPAPTEPYVGVVPQPQRIVQIVPADPLVIQVPQYSPAVVFGPPPTLYYPVYNAYPPRYVPSTSIISFGLGLAVGAILWSDTDWHHHRVYTRGRGGYRDDYRGGYGGYDRWSRDRYSSQGYSPWRHDSSHRRGESYRSPVVSRRYMPNGYDPRDNRGYGKSDGYGPHDNRNHEKSNGRDSRDNRDYGKSNGRDSRDNRDSGRPDGHDARDNREFNRPDGHDARENRDLQRPDARGLDAGPGRMDKDRSDSRPSPPGARGPQGGPGDKAHGPQGGRDDHGAKNAPPARPSPGGPSMEKPRGGPPQPKPSMEKPRGGSSQPKPSMDKPRGGSPQSKPSIDKSRGGSPSSARSGSGRGNASRPPSSKQGGSSGDRGGSSKSDKGGGGDKKKDDSGKDAKQGGGHGR